MKNIEARLKCYRTGKRIVDLIGVGAFPDFG